MNKNQVIVGLVLFLGALLMRMPGIAFHSLWFDEASTAFNIVQPDLLKSLNTTESTPPLFFFLEKAVIDKLHLPLNEFSLRILPVLFGSGICVLYFFIFRAVSNANIGFLAYLLITLGNFPINSSHDARSYSLFGFIALVSLWFTLQWWKNSGLKNSIALIVSIALLIQTHYYAAFWVGALLLSVFLVKMRDRRLKRYVLIVSCAALTSIVVLVPLLLDQAAYQFDSSKQYLLAKWVPGIIYTPVKVLVGAYLFKIRNFSDVTWTGMIGIIPVIIIIAIALARFIRRLNNGQVSDQEKIISFALLSAFGIHVALGWIIPCIHPRYMEYHLALLFGFIVINTARRAWVLTGVMALLITINVIANVKYYTSPKPYLIPWRTIGATIDSYVEKNSGNPVPVLAHYSLCLPAGFYVRNTSVPFYQIPSPMNPDKRFSYAKLNLFDKDFYTELYHYHYFTCEGTTSFMDLVTKLEHGILIDKVETSVEEYLPMLKEKYRGVIDFTVISNILTNQGTVYLINWRYRVSSSGTNCP
jgi:4-amino-4-deoxy-L-arabinose transferase-like glycosyltransferase